MQFSSIVNGIFKKEGKLIFLTYFNGTVKHILHMQAFLRYIAFQLTQTVRIWASLHKTTIMILVPEITTGYQLTDLVSEI